MLNNKKKIVDYKLYTSKRNKNPDYLFKVIEKYRGKIPKYQDQNCISLEMQVRHTVKRQMVQKRVRKIMDTFNQTKVSAPVPFKVRTWVPPLEQQKNQKNQYNHTVLPSISLDNSIQKENKITKCLNILDLNRKLRNFGEWLETVYDGIEKQNVKQAISNKQSKISYLTKKFNNLQTLKGKSLLITNNSRCSQFFSYKTLNNPLTKDEFFQKVMRTKDSQLMNILVETLSINGSFTFSSFINFYDIFIWQQAARKDIIYFVTKLLIGERKQASIHQISQKIKYFCSKIDLAEISGILQGFEDVIKKLIFAQQFPYSDDSKYYLTRQALQQSLEKNEECISIFINIFYAD